MIRISQKKTGFFIPITFQFSQAVKIFRWLDQINLTESGKSTLRAISQSGHQLTIYHSDAALISAGLTSAPLSSNLTNGKGENVEIKFYLKMGKEGTNCVLGEKNQYIEYTAIQNLFHELAHARHKMNGTWLYFASEKQAILDENQFRIDWAKYRSHSKAEQRNEYAENEEIVKLTEGKCILQKFASQKEPANSLN